MAVSTPTDYYASARRHMKDAELLESHRRFANAGHLYGYMAECGLKALLVWHHYPTDAGGSLLKADTGNFRVHVDKLVVAETYQELVQYLKGRSGSKYLAMLPNIRSFSDWRVEHRYYGETALPASLPAWKLAAKDVGRMLDKARLDGRT